MRGSEGVFRVYFVSETAQVELKSGRVQTPAQDSGPEEHLAQRHLLEVHVVDPHADERRHGTRQRHTPGAYTRSLFSST